MRKIAITAAMLIMTAGIARGTEELRLNGKDWKAMSRNSKHSWIMGFLAGSLASENEKYIKISKIPIDQLRKDMDQFYNDKEDEKVAMIDAIHIVKMGIDGKRAELIEVQKKYLRMQPVDAITEASKILIDYKDVKYVKELFLRDGYFAEPKSDNPIKNEDYLYTPLFRFGIYE